MALITLTGGLYQLHNNTALANGHLIWELSHDSRETTDANGGQVVSGIKIKVNLDSNGSVSGTAKLWANDQLQPSGSYYTVTGYASDGTIAFASPQYYQIASSPSTLNLGTLVPFTPPSNLVAANILTQPTPTVTTGQVGIGTTTATSATLGSNGAVPAQVAGYLVINIAGTNFKLPYFNS